MQRQELVSMSAMECQRQWDNSIFTSD